MKQNEAWAEAASRFPEGCVFHNEDDGLREGVYTDSEGGQWSVAVSEEGFEDFGPF